MRATSSFSDGFSLSGVFFSLVWTSVLDID